MSQNIDDSPNSDNKMDISEPTTISQESIGFSPETEHQPLMTLPESVKIRTIHTTINNKMRTSNKYFGSDQHDNKFPDNSLDNRNLVNKMSLSNPKQRASMTQVEMHPLMEPPSRSDDDLSPDSSTMFDGADTFQDFIQMETDPPIESTLIKHFDSLNVPNTNQNIDDKHFISSGESEADTSQYQALVEPTFQSVSLANYNMNKVSIASKPNNNLRKIPLTNELKLIATREDSSVETISNNSFDDDVEDEDGFNFTETKSNTHVASSNGDDLTHANGFTNNDGAQQAAAVSVTLSNGQTRNIDMKVIEPYKRCLSHGGYIKSPGHNAIVIFSACYLPDRSRTDYHYVMENLFLYVIKTLDQFVTEDYILIYLHGGSTRNTVPPLPWLKKCYHLLDRRIRKSLKNLYMVHPTFWLKSIVWMARPFISSKFWRKLVYIRTLDDLYKIIPVEKAAVPDKVKLYDIKHS